MADVNVYGMSEDAAAATGRMWDQMHPLDEPSFMGLWFGNMTIASHRNRHYQLRWARGQFTERQALAKTNADLRAQLAAKK